MPANGEADTLYSSKAVTRNTIYNLLGMGLPLILAVFVLPALIKGFGDEKFGILSLAWVVIGYFTFFDFGIARTLTKIIAEKLGLNKREEIPSIFWTSIFLIIGVSILAMFLFLFLSPVLVYDILNISPQLQQESLHTFYLLALSIPLVTTTAGLRGVLEAYQKFGIINIIRLFLGIFTFLGPLFCLFFTVNLFWVVTVLILLRFLVWIMYLYYCFKINSGFRKRVIFKKEDIKPILKLSGWMTVSNIASPLITYSDRFLIGAFLSAAAITYYATPLELVTRILLIPTAIVGVLFPVFSANYLANPDFSRRLFRTATKLIIIIVSPLVLLILTFASEGMNLWLGSKFAENSGLVLQFLSLGTLFNSVAYFPFTFLQSTGKPHIPAILYLVEIPLYLLLMWLGITYYGIEGAAFIWLVRTTIDSLMLFYYANKTLRFHFRIKYLLFLFVIIIAVIPFLLDNTFIKTILFISAVTLFSFFSWKYLLQQDERLYIRLNFFRKGFNV